MKKSDIVQELINDPKYKNFDRKYIEGLVDEQLIILHYKKLFGTNINEDINDEDDEEIEIEPEKITVDVPEEPEVEEPKIDDKEVEVIPDDENNEDDDEIEVKPELIPIKTPKIITEPEIIQKSKEEYKTISVDEARELLSYKGKIFQTVFKKKDGTIRAMNGMTGVRKYTSGGELPYSPKEKGLIPVYDLKIGMGAKGYRMINIEGLQTLNIDGQKYKIDHSLKEQIRKILQEVLNESKSPCWNGYKKVGIKEKNGKTVNNCVPINEYTIDDEEVEEFLEELEKCSYDLGEGILEESEYQGRKVTLNKPMQGDSKKFKVYVKNDKGNIVKVNFGAKGMNIKKNNPVRRKAFRARHNCENPGPKWKARYWSCKKW